MENTVCRQLIAIYSNNCVGNAWDSEFPDSFQKMAFAVSKNNYSNPAAELVFDKEALNCKT